MIKKIGYLLSILLVSFSVIANAQIPANKNATQTFITLADIHFDPFFSCKSLPKPCVVLKKLRQADYQQWDSILAEYPESVAGLGEDTNYPLLELTLNELKKINQTEKPQFVLILGDFLAHSFRDKYKKYSRDKSAINYAQFVRKTLQFMTYQLNQIFPNVNIYPVVGNNDTYTGNYNVVPKGAFLQDTADTWSLLIKNKNNQKNFLEDFPQFGYYAITLPNNQKILVLNTVLFSAKTHKKNMTIAANNQLQWLKQQLLSAQKADVHVIIAYHIPMGVDVFTSIKLYLFSITEFWQPVYSSEFEKILQQFSFTISAILPAHIHMDAYQLIPDANIPVIFTPSISPVYGNNPGFKLFTYNPNTLNINDYSTYSYSTNGSFSKEWNIEYSFQEIYNPHCEHCKISEGIINLKTNNALSIPYKKFYALGEKHPIMKNNDWEPYYRCNINNVSKSSYKACLRNE